MNRPKMIIFDYGHTLLYEPELDFIRGAEEVYKHIIKNPKQLTAEEISNFGTDLYLKFLECRKLGCELHEWQFMRLQYEYLGIELDISYEEAEILLWTNTSKGACMPYVNELLTCLKKKGIRSGVISNIGWSGNALKERINRLLPDNQFEFIIASSEYGIRKPDPMIFELALQKAGLQASDVWYCGDNSYADVYGANKVGFFPVHYEDKTIEDIWIGTKTEVDLDFDYLHINNWLEMVEILENLI